MNIRRSAIFINLYLSVNTAQLIISDQFPPISLTPEPLKFAVVKAVNHIQTRFNIDHIEYVNNWIYTYTDNEGYFHLVPYSNVGGNNSINYIRGSGIGTANFELGPYYNSQIDGGWDDTPLHNFSDIPVQHINPVLETSIDQSLVQLTESQVLSGWENLILTNTLVEGNWNQGGQLQASARDNVVLNVESNMQRGSEVHLFTDNTIYPSCSEWSYLLPTHEWRLGKVDNNPANISNINLKFIQLNDCKIYPNPGTGIFTIDFGNRNLKEPITCIIKNIQGSVLSSTLINECVTRIELEQFRSGIYIIELKSRDINLTKKIIKL